MITLVMVVEGGGDGYGSSHDGTHAAAAAASAGGGGNDDGRGCSQVWTATKGISTVSTFTMCPAEKHVGLWRLEKLKSTRGSAHYKFMVLESEIATGHQKPHGPS